MSGYVRIHRSLIGHPAFRNDAEAMAFAWLVARAAWQPTRVRYKERVISLARGQLAISVRDFANAMDRDKAWCERLLKRLKSETMIETRHETGVNVVTICKYEQYQSRGLRGETLDETPPKTGARQGRDTEQGSEEREEGNPPKPPRGRVREKCCLPQDWALPSLSDLPPRARACASQWPDAAYQTEGEAFACYWRSERKMKSDWNGTWANRIVSRHSSVMRDQKYGTGPPASTRSQPTMTAAMWRDRAEFYDKIGKRDDAEKCRKLAIGIEQQAAA